MNPVVYFCYLTFKRPLMKDQSQVLLSRFNLTICLYPYLWYNCTERERTFTGLNDLFFFFCELSNTN